MTENFENAVWTNRPYNDGDSIMATLNDQGDSKYCWNGSDEKEVELALAHFNSMRNKGFLAYKVEGPEDARSRTQLVEFDPKAERVVFAPAPQGG